MRASKTVILIVGVVIAATSAVVGCASPAATPTLVPTATQTVSLPSPTATLAPTATVAMPTAAPTVGESLKSQIATSTPASPVGESLKPATATPGGSADSLKTATTPTSVRQPAATPPSIRDSLKPVESPTTAQKTATPAQGSTNKRITPVKGLQAQPTPVAARKGVANANVNPQKYAEEMVTDLLKLAEAVDGLGTLMGAYQGGGIDENRLVAGFNQQAEIIRTIYQREVQRDFPPQFKEIDDYYVESLRSATKMTDSLVLALQTGDEKYVVEAQGHAQKFEYFFNELARRLQ